MPFCETGNSAGGGTGPNVRPSVTGTAGVGASGNNGDADDDVDDDDDDDEDIREGAGGEISATLPGAFPSAASAGVGNTDGADVAAASVSVFGSACDAHTVPEEETGVATAGRSTALTGVPVAREAPSEREDATAEGNSTFEENSTPLSGSAPTFVPAG